MTGTADFLAVDLGASSGRVLLGSWTGKKFALKELHRFPNGGVSAPGGIYWDVLRLWSEIKNGVLLANAQGHRHLAGISVDGWGVDFGLLDSSGELLGSPHQYRDPRTDGLVEEVDAKLDLAALYGRIGVQTMQINTLFQLYSLVKNSPKLLEIAETLLMIPDLFHFFLSGEKRMEYTEASTTQIFAASTRSWDDEAIEKLPIPGRLFPRIVEPGTILAPLRRSIVEELGLKDVFPVIAGASHDTASAIAAVPSLDANSAFLSSGTWSLIGVETVEPVTSEQAFHWDFTNEGGADGTVLLMKNLPGLWLVQECQKQWAREGKEYSWSELVGLAEQSQPFAFFLDSEDKSFLNPLNMPEAIRRYCKETGQGLPSTAGEIVRSCLENITYKYRETLDRLESLTGRKLTTVRVVGGGSKNALLCQFTANATGRVVVAGPVEASALGNVMIQAVATGCLPDIATGRDCIAASEDFSVYSPKDIDQWNDEYGRYTSFLSLKKQESYGRA